MPFSISDLVQGGGVIVALYYAVQMRMAVFELKSLSKNHEVRITGLETANVAVPSRPKRRNRTG